MLVCTRPRVRPYAAPRWANIVGGKSVESITHGSYMESKRDAFYGHKLAFMNK